MAPHIKVVAFDIIGTMFTMEPMRPALVGLGLPPLGLDLLYAAALRDTFALAVTSTFAPFQSVLADCLDELLAIHGLTAPEERRRDILAMMASLPPHADAKEALQLLRGAGIGVVALSNGSLKSTRGLLNGAGLDGHFDRILSVDDVGLSKPRPETYRYAAQAAGTELAELALVAAHPWDVHGAKIAGLTTGYVARGRSFPAVLRAPDVLGETLLDVARELMRS